MSGPDKAAALAGAEKLATDFLGSVLPHEGLYFIVTPTSNGGYHHHACHSVTEAARRAIALDAQGKTVYFATASFKAPYIYIPGDDGKPKRYWRIRDNVRALRTLFLDVDVGKPGTYATPDEAVDELMRFCRETGLPTPYVVLSGRGLHLYWRLDKDVAVDTWQPAADKLKALCTKLQFKTDPGPTANPSCVLRVVGTTHRKDPNDPRVVDVIPTHDTELPFETVCSILDAACARHGVDVAYRHESSRVGATEAERLNEAFEVKREFPPFSAHAVAERCQQFRRMRDLRGCIPEPEWYVALQMLVNSVEGEPLAHEWSSGYSGYTHGETARKLERVRDMGPPLCTTLDSRNPGGCEGCVFKGVVKTPAQVGHALQSKEPAASGVEQIEISTQPGARPVEWEQRARQSTAALPNMIILPSNSYNFTQSAQTIFPRLASTNRYFMRGGELVSLFERAEAEYSLCLEHVSVSEFRSLLETLGLDVLAHVQEKNGGVALKKKLCSKDSADALMKTAEARTIMPPIRLVSRSQVMIAHGNTAKILDPGYHKDLGGILVTSRAQIPIVNLPEAISALKSLLTDFDFVSPGDRSRAIASMLTPAIRMGGLLLETPGGVAHCPVIVVEANDTQAGKGYLQRIIRSIYNERGYTVTQREGGVGSLDESISQALLSGQPFVVLDNFRGRLNSKFLESIMTDDGTANARVPHRGEVNVDIRGVTFQMTSNGVDTTPDFANRSSIIRIKKRPDGYRFTKWPGGDLVGHVWDNAGYYLACVFSVLCTWVAAGRPGREDEVEHDFRTWAGALNWIVKNVFKEAALLDGHRSAQKRVSNPALGWLREMCLAAERAKLLDQELSASAIVELCEEEGVPLVGLQAANKDGGAVDRDTQARIHVGKLLARCFREVGPDQHSIDVDGFIVIKVEREERDQQRHNKTVKRYRILRPASCAS